MPETSGTFTMLAGAAIIANRLLQLSSGEAIHLIATSTLDPIGSAMINVDDGDDVSVRAINDSGKHELCAAGAITAGVDVYAAAAGKIQALPVGAGTYRKIGKALEAATADGDIIEVLPYDYGTTTTVTE